MALLSSTQYLNKYIHNEVLFMAYNYRDRDHTKPDIHECDHTRNTQRNRYIDVGKHILLILSTKIQFLIVYHVFSYRISH